MLELDPAGERFGQLLDLIDNPAGKRGVGQERFPFVGQSSAEIGDDGLATADIGKTRPLHDQPVYGVDLPQSPDMAIGNDREAAANVPLGVHVEELEPDDVQQKAAEKADTIVGKAGEDEP